MYGLLSDCTVRLAKGGTTARAHQVFQDIIAGFEAPPMDEGIREELADFVARRKAEGGAPTDF